VKLIVLLVASIALFLAGGLVEFAAGTAGGVVGGLLARRRR
jgi:hypothetical protein